VVNGVERGRQIETDQDGDLLVISRRVNTVEDIQQCSLGRVTSSVCQSVTLVSPAKTAEPIEMPFVLRTQVGAWNNMSPHPIEGERSPILKYMGHSVMSCARSDGPILMIYMSVCL